MNELPLQELFTKLREAGLQLGIDEYQLVLRSLQGGFGVADKAALKRLCQTLWVKSQSEKSILDYHFEQVIGCDVAPTEENSETVNKSRLSQIYLIIPFLILGMLGVGIIYNHQKHSREKQLITQPTPTPTPIATATEEAKPPTTNQAEETNPQPTPTTQATPKPILTTKRINLLIWMILFLTATSCEYLLYRWVCNWLSKRKADSQSPPTSAPPTNEVQVVKSVLQSTIDLPSDFFPVTQRQMKQIWRYLRRPVREGKPTQLDVKATINHIGNQGILIEPVLIPSRVNRAELLLIIDQDGSMVPFHAFSHRLAETALGGGRLGKTGIYYFHNCPVEYLYRDRYHQEAELVSHVVSHICSERTAVLIFSDGGAARGGNSQERYQLTEEFLTKLQQRVRHIAWLNPMPKKRWFGTTAGKISTLVPMFEATRPSLQDAISVLRGKPTNFEGRRK